MKTQTIIILSVLGFVLLAFGIYAYNERKKVEAEAEAEQTKAIVNATKGPEPTKFGQIWDSLGGAVELVGGLLGGGKKNQTEG